MKKINGPILFTYLFTLIRQLILDLPPLMRIPGRYVLNLDMPLFIVYILLNSVYFLL